MSPTAAMTFLHPLSLFDRSKSRATIAWQLLDNDVVEGRVIDIAGEPVSGLSLFASVSSNEQFSYNRSITRKDGTFGLRLSDGTYTVSASCKKRGFCPSCMGLRMADTATRLTDDDVRTIVETTAQRVRLCQRRGLFEEGSTDPLWEQMPFVQKQLSKRMPSRQCDRGSVYG
jgi:hypothetical protein